MQKLLIIVGLGKLPGKLAYRGNDAIEIKRGNVNEMERI